MQTLFFSEPPVAPLGCEASLTWWQVAVGIRLMNFLFIYSCIQAAKTLYGERKHMKTHYIKLYCTKRNHNTGHLFFAHSGNPKIPKYLKISILGSASNMVITYKRWLFFHRLQWRLLTIAKQGEGHHSINPIGLHHTNKTVKDSDMQLLCPFNLWIEQSTPTGKVPGISPIRCSFEPHIEHLARTPMDQTGANTMMTEPNFAFYFFLQIIVYVGLFELVWSVSCSTICCISKGSRHSPLYTQQSSTLSKPWSIYWSVNKWMCS